MNTNTLIDEQITKIAFEELLKWGDTGAWQALTYDSGPYEITTLRPIVEKIARAIESAVRGAPDAPQEQSVHPAETALEMRAVAVTQEDVADIIAGALQTSRAHAYELMADAINGRYPAGSPSREHADTDPKPEPVHQAGTALEMHATEGRSATHGKRTVFLAANVVCRHCGRPRRDHDSVTVQCPKPVTPEESDAP